MDPAADKLMLTSTYVTAIATNPLTPTTLFAGTNQGVFRSDNESKNWQFAGNGITSTYIYALAINPIDPRIVYAGTSGGGVFKTIDNGLNWTPVISGLNNLYVHAMVIDPLTPTIVYAATPGGVCLRHITKLFALYTASSKWGGLYAAPILVNDPVLFA